MIKLKDYPKQKKPVVVKVKYGSGKILRYVGEVNGCRISREPWEYLAWQRAFERGAKIPEPFAGKMPEGARMGDAFLYSLYDGETVEKILEDAGRDPDIRKMLELRDAESKLLFELFPPDA